MRKITLTYGYSAKDVKEVCIKTFFAKVEIAQFFIDV